MIGSPRRPPNSRIRPPAINASGVIAAVIASAGTMSAWAPLMNFPTPSAESGIPAAFLTTSTLRPGAQCHDGDERGECHDHAESEQTGDSSGGGHGRTS